MQDLMAEDGQAAACPPILLRPGVTDARVSARPDPRAGLQYTSTVPVGLSSAAASDLYSSQPVPQIAAIRSR